MSGVATFSAGGWQRAVLLGLIGLVVAGLSTRSALERIMASARPDLVLSFAPADPRALDVTFKRALDRGAVTPRDFATWSARARGALVESPLEPAMLRIMSVDPTFKRPERLLDLAERISRRDALVELALIEVSVNAGRVDQALVHYDRALSVFPDMRGVLFPILTNALSEQNIRSALTRLAARQRPWVDPFLALAVRESAKPADVAALLSAMSRLPSPPPSLAEHQATLAGRFVTAQDYRTAASLARMATRTDPGAIDRVALSPATWQTAARPLTWTGGEAEGVDADLIDDGTAQISARPGATGLALFRILVRQPGRYRFKAGVARSPEVDAAAGRWTFLCLKPSGARTLASAAFAAGRTGSVTTDFDLPRDCGGLRIDLTVDNAASGTDGGFLLRDVRLTLQGPAL